ncbi:threonine ammonia-lyase [Alterisphingorhabdus coralli]|uniref:Pyridoxal-phosphate dependent enzyme n=1 Tax=Alterisphingorhabdus coralli TaxID=3071408 RepID=A0AA97HZM0_9SPHN|nr:pyridoxal-phosphate dependent enzyme [Parasphingorhabdus sp. SCSIO 66989]WOE73982.1 pyridoxal-phosphate dependent enzyme [Parasphingorhabdus sp. SCSIO 66989]
MTAPSHLLHPGRKPSAEGVERAAHKIGAILPPTPLLPLEVDGRTIWCKAECLQPIGAFKIRGGWHRLTDLTEEQREKGVVAFSSGNHAQGVAWAAQKLGISAVIIMPGDAPAAKMQATKQMGAEVITYDRMTGSREAMAADIAEQTGATIVPSFDDPWIIEGQGSCGFEICEQMIAQTGQVPDQLIACCGGGGLAAGSALANPEAEVVVVEPEGWDDMRRSLELGEIVPVGDNPPPTRCDALQTMRVSPLTFEVLHQRGAKGIAVTEAEVEHAMRVAFAKLHLVLEPGGAVALAAALVGKVPLTDSTAITLSGGNVDAAVYAQIVANGDG